MDTILPYISTVLTCTLYSLFLAWIKRTRWNYEPDFTWLTVVGGNAILGFHLWWLLGWEVFVVVLLVNIAGGLPVISWQFIELIQRLHQLRQHKEGVNATAEARR
jgi:hypothetical protein